MARQNTTGTREREDDGAKSAERLLEVVRALALELHPYRREVEQAGPSASLERDFGIDSLARVELNLRIEQSFAVRLPEELVMAAESPAELLRAIGAAMPAAPGAPPGPAITAPPKAAPTPVEAATLVDALAFHVDRHGDRPHVHLLGAGEREEVVTYQMLWDGAERVAAGLRDRDLEMGQRVAIMLPTGRAFFEAYFGALLAGGVPVPIYPPFRRSAIGEHLRRHAGILGNAQVPVLIAPEEARLFGRLMRSQVETLRHLATVEELRLASTEVARPVLKSGSLALVQYTSGSTGDPKGVILSHQNLLANIRAMGQVFDVRSDDVVVSWLPLYHDMGLIGCWLGSLYHACPLVLMSPLAFLGRPSRWLRTIHRYRGTLSAAPNFAYDLCASKVAERDMEGVDLGSWRMAGNGAEAVSAQTIEAFRERFAQHGFRAEAMTPMYGLAECAVALTCSPLGRGAVIDRVDRNRLARRGHARPAEKKGAATATFVSCGTALPGHEVRVVDTAGRELGERTQGRLQFRGPSATIGYLRNPAKTAELFHDDWLETGDLGYVAAGELYVTGRIKDMIVRAGRNVHPAEIEEVIGELAGVRKGRVAVFAARDRATGTEGLVVLAESRLRDPESRAALTEEIHTQVTDLVELPPDDIVLGPPGSVLKTLNGKVRRADCARLYEAGEIGRQAPALWRQLFGLVGTGLGPELRRFGRALDTLAFYLWFWGLYRLLSPFVFATVLALPRIAWRRSVLRRAARLLLRLLGAGPAIQSLGQMPAREPCVIVANHASFLDSLVLSAVLPPDFAFVAKRELAGSIVAGRFLEALGTAFVERFDLAKGVADTRQLSATLAEGQSLVFYPEGTFDRRPGLRSFEMGAFIVAAEADVPLVPIGIHGTRSMLRADSAFPRRSRIAVTVGRPIQVEGRDWQAAMRLRDQARAAILKTCGEPDLIYEAKPVLERGRASMTRNA
jgi:1-acyl-sn-glycerol-3-phosphate acyltransferase